MKIRKTTGLLFVTAAVVLVLFDVSFPFDIASSSESEIPDPAVEAKYRRCYDERDEAMHHVAFGTIDNPDVQKEYIATNRDRIERECRAEVPAVMIVVREPARFNAVDFEPRFW